MAARAKNHPDSSSGRRNRTVFVGNVDFNTEDWQIEDFASQFGEVERVSVPKTPEGRSRGFCFIQFKDQSSVRAALDQSGISLNGRQVAIKEQTEREKRPRRDDYNDERY